MSQYVKGYIPAFFRGISWLLYTPLDGKANDESGNNNAITVTGGCAPGHGAYHFNRITYDFDGSTGYLNCGNGVNVTTSYSFLAWFFPTALPTSGNLETIFKKAFNGATDPYDCFLWNNTGVQTIRFHQRSGATHYNCDVICTVPLNQWSCVIGTYDGSTMRLMVFTPIGYFQNSVAASGTVDNNASPFCIGVYDSNGSFLYYFPGKIAQVAVANLAVISPADAWKYYLWAINPKKRPAATSVAPVPYGGKTYVQQYTGPTPWGGKVKSLWYTLTPASAAAPLKFSVSNYRNLSAAMVTAQTTAGMFQPSIHAKVVDDEFYNTNAYNIASGNKCGTYQAMATAPDGTIFRVGNNGNDFALWKITSPTTVAQWTGAPFSTIQVGWLPQSLPAYLRPSIAISDWLNGLYEIDVSYPTVSGGTVTINVMKSTDGGATFAAKASGAPLTFSSTAVIASAELGDINHLFISYQASGTYSTLVWYKWFGSSWGGPYVWNGVQNAQYWFNYGMAAKLNANGVYTIAFCGTRNVIANGSEVLPSLYTVQLLDDVNNVWSQTRLVYTVTNTANSSVYIQSPAVFYDGTYTWITAFANYVQSSDATATNYQARYLYFRSKDGINFSLPQMFQSFTPYVADGMSGQMLVNASDGNYYFGGQLVVMQYNGNTTIADITNELLGYNITEYADGAPVSYSVTIANPSGKWIGAAPTGTNASVIKQNKKLAIYQGYYLSGVEFYTLKGLGYIDEVNLKLDVNSNTFQLNCRDRLKNLRLTSVPSSVDYTRTDFYDDVFDGTTINNYAPTNSTYPWVESGGTFVPSVGSQSGMILNKTDANWQNQMYFVGLLIDPAGAATSIPANPFTGTPGMVIWLRYIDANNKFGIWIFPVLVSGQLQLFAQYCQYVGGVFTGLNTISWPSVPYPNNWPTNNTIYLKVTQLDWINYEAALIVPSSNHNVNYAPMQNYGTLSNSYQNAPFTTGSYSLAFEGVQTTNANLKLYRLSLLKFRDLSQSYEVLTNLMGLASVWNPSPAPIQDEQFFTAASRLRNKGNLMLMPGNTQWLLGPPIYSPTDRTTVTGYTSVQDAEVRFVAKLVPQNNTDTLFKFGFFFRSLTPTGVFGTNQDSYALEIVKKASSSANLVWNRYRMSTDPVPVQLTEMVAATEMYPSTDSRRNFPTWNAFDPTAWNEYRIVFYRSYCMVYVNNVPALFYGDMAAISDAGNFATGSPKILTAGGAFGFFTGNNTQVLVKNMTLNPLWQPVQGFILQPATVLDTAARPIPQRVNGWYYLDHRERLRYLQYQDTQPSKYAYSTFIQNQYNQSMKEYVNQIIFVGDGASYVMTDDAAVQTMGRVYPRTVIDYKVTTLSDAQARARQELYNAERYQQQPDLKVINNPGSELYEVVKITDATNGIADWYRMFSQRTYFTSSTMEYTLELGVAHDAPPPTS